MAPLATGALSGLASTGVSKIFGNGLIVPVPPPKKKQQELLNKAGSYLTNAHINQMLKSNKVKPTKKQSQDGGCLPLLLGSLGSLTAPVLGSLFGKGPQVDAQQRPFNRVPQGKGLQVDAQQRLYRRVKIKNFCYKPISNFDIMNWVKGLKIKNKNDGVFNKDNRQWAFDNNNCGIINLDSNNGPGTHLACYVDFFYHFDPFGLPPPEKYSFYRTIQYFTISKMISVLCGYFCLFSSFKKFKMVVQFMPFCIRF